MENELKRFKLLGRCSDEDSYKNTLKSMNMPCKSVIFGIDTPILSPLQFRQMAGRAGRRGFDVTVVLTPCKSVIFGIDTPILSPLQFRQMAGRAGRRGFDATGTVVFMALPTGSVLCTDFVVFSKIRRLLTSELASLRGNIPFNASFMLRLLRFVQADLVVKEQLTKKEEALNHFARDTRAARIKLLRKHQLLNEKCELTSFAYLAEQLSEFQPGNLMFAVVLQSGSLHRLFLQEKKKDSLKPFKSVFINILANLFTNMPFPPYSFNAGEDLEHEPVLKPMPKEIAEVIRDYSNDVNGMFVAFLELVFGKKLARDAVLSLSGKGDRLNIFDVHMISNFSNGLLLDDAFVPALSLETYDHRGNKILRNSYAVEFWKSENVGKLIHDNKCLIGDVWYLVNDLNRVLQTVSEMIKLWSNRAKKADELSNLVQEVAEEFDKKFRRGFGMKEEKADE